MSDPLPSDIEEALSAESERLGVFADHFNYFSVVPSTNDVALRLAEDGAQDGTIVLAAAQTAGRGRRGREWFSPVGGLYFSVIMRGLQSPTVTLMAGVGVAEGIRISTGLAVEIQWPNDVVLPTSQRNGQAEQLVKVAGILSEAPRIGKFPEAMIVGIGINVGRTDYPPALSSRASSLEFELRRPVDRASVLVESLAALTRWLHVVHMGNEPVMLNRWRELAPSSEGSIVVWKTQERDQQGITDGIDTDGALRVRCGSQVQRLVAGEVTWGAPSGTRTLCKGIDAAGN
jgi:BirA family biotin operon repressor/biotin-[acetyl-CoA-carboxylase] ligase